MNKLYRVYATSEWTKGWVEVTAKAVDSRQAKLIAEYHGSIRGQRAKKVEVL